MNADNQSPIVIYQAADKTVEVRLDTGQETVWLTQRQMAHQRGAFQHRQSREPENAGDFQPGSSKLGIFGA